MLSRAQIASQGTFAKQWFRQWSGVSVARRLQTRRLLVNASVNSSAYFERSDGFATEKHSLYARVQEHTTAEPLKPGNDSLLRLLPDYGLSGLVHQSWRPCTDVFLHMLSHLDYAACDEDMLDRVSAVLMPATQENRQAVQDLTLDEAFWWLSAVGSSPFYWHHGHGNLPLETVQCVSKMLDKLCLGDAITCAHNLGLLVDSKSSSLRNPILAPVMEFMHHKTVACWSREGQDLFPEAELAHVACQVLMQLVMSQADDVTHEDVCMGMEAMSMLGLRPTPMEAEIMWDLVEKYLITPQQVQHESQGAVSQDDRRSSSSTATTTAATTTTTSSSSSLQHLLSRAVVALAAMGATPPREGAAEVMLSDPRSWCSADITRMLIGMRELGWEPQDVTKLARCLERVPDLVRNETLLQELASSGCVRFSPDKLREVTTSFLAQELEDVFELGTPYQHLTEGPAPRLRRWITILAGLGYQPEADDVFMVHFMSEFSQTILAGMEFDDAVAILSTLKHVKYQPSNEWLELLCRDLVASGLSSSSPAQVRVKVKVLSMLLSDATEFIPKDGFWHFYVNAVFGLLQDKHEGVCEAFLKGCFESVASLLRHRLRDSSPAIWADVVAPAVQRLIQTEQRHEELLSVYIACAKLGMGQHRPDVMLSLETNLGPALRHATGIPASAIQRVFLHAASSSGLDVSRGFVAHLSHVVQEKSDELSAQDLVVVLSALDQWRAGIPLSWVHHCIQRVCTDIPAVRSQWLYLLPSLVEGLVRGCVCDEGCRTVSKEWTAAMQYEFGRRAESFTDDQKEQFLVGIQMLDKLAL